MKPHEVARKYLPQKTGVQMTSTTSTLRRKKPRTPGNRHTAMIDKRDLWRGRPVMELTVGLRKTGGRNNQGRMTVYGRGGGNKRRYRFIDFKRDYFDQPAVVQRFEYDPNRSAFIALIAYQDGNVSYIIAPQAMEVGDTIVSSRTNEVEIRAGNAMPLKNIPIGTNFHNLEIKPGKGAQIARSAGTACQLMDKGTKPGYALVAITSKEQRYVDLECMGTIGVVSNEQWHLQNYGKAGRMRWLGRRPKVRGVAMNPVDHPMGGGEGRSSGGRPSCSRTGLLSKGYKTVRKKRNNLIVVPRGGRKRK